MNADTNALQAMDQMPIRRALIKNIVPAILAMLMMLVYNMADKVFVAMANNDYMVAGVTLVTPVFLIFMAVGNIFGTGGVALMSQYAGGGKQKKIDNVSSFCFWSALVLGVMVGILLLAFREPILALLGANGGETLAYTRDYYTYIVISAPCAILSPTLANLIRAEGKPGLSTAGSVIGNLTNIVLDPIFILGLNMGTKGAAIATALGNVVAVVCYLAFIFAKKSRISIRPADFTGKEKIASSVYAIGITAAIATVGQSICQILMNNKMAAYGDMPVAGIGAAYNIVTIVMVFALGIGQGCQPLLGFQVGRQNKAKFKQILRHGYLSLIIVCLILTALCYGFMEPIIRVFVTSAEAVNYGIEFGKIVVCTAWIYGVFQMSSQVIQIMGRATAALVVSLSKNAYIFIPSLYLCSAAGGMYGIAWSMPVSDVISAVISLVVMAYTMKHCFAGSDLSAGVTESSVAPTVEMSRVQELRNAYVITIGRSYGAGGRSVGKLLAEKLGVPFYDKELMEATAKESGLSEQFIAKMDEAAGGNAVPDAGSIFTTNRVLHSVEDLAYQAQRSVVQQLAKAGPCVMVGRRADQILADDCPIFRVFVSSSFADRVNRVAAREKRSPEDSAKKIRQMDKERAKYYNSLSGPAWGAAETYDLSVDTGTLGVEGAVEVILTALEQWNEASES